MGLGFIDSNFNKSTAITAVLPAKLIHLSTYCHTFGQTQRMQYLGDIPVKQLLPGFWGKMVHGDSSTLAYWEIKKGSRLPEHSHLHEQITLILDGELEMVIGGEKYLLTAGATHAIPSTSPTPPLPSQTARSSTPSHPQEMTTDKNVPYGTRTRPQKQRRTQPQPRHSPRPSRPRPQPTTTATPTASATTIIPVNLKQVNRAFVIGIILNFLFVMIEVIVGLSASTPCPCYPTPATTSQM
jgi:hypothetical protein